MHCVLPVREGVSRLLCNQGREYPFPPCTGGCIEYQRLKTQFLKVSSLYGRVYRRKNSLLSVTWSFLPVREGVSKNSRVKKKKLEFPPCTGGCIEQLQSIRIATDVSSLYGRVYRLLELERKEQRSFLPVREGVSMPCCMRCQEPMTKVTGLCFTSSDLTK